MIKSCRGFTACTRHSYIKIFHVSTVSTEKYLQLQRQSPVQWEVISFAFNRERPRGLGQVKQEWNCRIQNHRTKNIKNQLSSNFAMLRSINSYKPKPRKRRSRIPVRSGRSSPRYPGDEPEPVHFPPILPTSRYWASPNIPWHWVWVRVWREWGFRVCFSWCGAEQTKE